ncbi:hypothetical protein DSUL_260010 [Desulfovibrionales bacterium]
MVVVLEAISETVLYYIDPTGLRPIMSFTHPSLIPATVVV